MTQAKIVKPKKRTYYDIHDLVEFVKKNNIVVYDKNKRGQDRALFEFLSDSEGRGLVVFYCSETKANYEDYLADKSITQEEHDMGVAAVEFLRKNFGKEIKVNVRF